MTTKDDAEKTDVEPVQIWSAKELEAEINVILKTYRDKETEENWEARERAITRLRGILRGNASEKYLDTLIPLMKQMVDGIVKAVESLRTQLAINALYLVADIGRYIGKHINNYIIDHLMLCLMRCASLTKKIVAQASLQATSIFLKHSIFYPKVMNLFLLSMNEKNSQVRLYVVTYTKVVLQAHAHRDHTRAVMDKTGSTDQCETIITKGLNDPTPNVKDACREAFWIFWEHWRDRGEHILRKLSPSAQKQLDKAKTVALSRPKNGGNISMNNHDNNNINNNKLHSPTNSSSSLRTTSSLGSHRQITDINDAVSPSSSSTSNGSSGSGDHPHSQQQQQQQLHHGYEQQHTRSIKRAMSPRATSPSMRSTSPHVLRSYGSPPSISSQLHTNYVPPSSPPPVRKTRVPGLTRKKSTVGLKRKVPNFMVQLTSDDFTAKVEGIHQLEKKLAAYPYQPIPDLHAIQLETGTGPPVDGQVLKGMILQFFTEDVHPFIYEALSSWDGITGVMLKLLTFDEYIPKLILDANMDENSRRTESDLAKYTNANLALKRAKIYLQQEHPNLVDTLFTSLVQFGGFGVDTRQKLATHTLSKKDPTRLPANRRKLTRCFLEWIDELVTPMIGLSEEYDLSDAAFEGIPPEYLEVIDQNQSEAQRWFESDDNVRYCLSVLLPHVMTSSSGSISHEPLIAFVKHLRLLNQRLFEMVAATYDDQAINKICRVLGIHIRVIPEQIAPITTPLQPQHEEEEEEEEQQQLFDEHEEEEEQVELKEEQEEEEEVDQEIPVIETEIGHGAPSLSSQPQLENKYKEEEDNGYKRTREIGVKEDYEKPLENKIEKPLLTVKSFEDDEKEFQAEEDIDAIDNQKEVYDEELFNETAAPYETLAQTEPVIDYKQDYFDDKPIDGTGGHLVPELNQQQEDTRQFSREIASSLSPSSTSEPIINHNISDTTQHLVPPLPQQQQQQQQQEDKKTIISRVEEEEGYPNNNNHTLENGAIPSNVLYTNGNIMMNDTISLPPPHDDVLYENQENVDYSTTPVLTNDSLDRTATTKDDDDTSSNATTIVNTSQIITASIPNKEKYPIPTSVAFFAPSKVVAPCPIFQKGNTRVTNASSRHVKDKAVQLYAFIDKLNSSNGSLSSVDVATFRKLTRLFKEVPIRRRWDQGGCEEDGSETWAGANEDGGNFVETIQAILVYLEQPPSKLTVAVLECVRQLAVTQTGLFRFYERKVDEHGMSLEARIMEHLLLIRSNENPTICIAAEDALDAVLGTLSSLTAFEMLMAFIIHRLIIAPDLYNDLKTRYHPVGSAFMYLGKWVKEINDTFYIDEWLVKGGVNAFFKGINDPLITVRKSCVEAIVSFHDMIGDNLYTYLADLREDQMNLVRHYVVKSLKKKASLRNLRDNGQF